MVVRSGVIASRARQRHAALTERSRETADLTLRLLEFLTQEPGPCGVTELAQRFATSKATIHRHLRTLANREFVRQDPLTQRYEPGVKLFQLGERLRDRFGVLAAARSEMVRLRDETGQAVTLSTLAEGKVVVLDLVQGHSVVEFGIRPGTQMSLHCSAHGKVALAFGPATVLERCLAGPLAALSPDSVKSAGQLRKQVTAVQRQGWATAANEVVFGMNALAAPVFDHRGGFAGAIAIVGSTQFIGPRPAAAQLAQVTGAAARISRQLGWSPA
ncbi:MAG: IclR family transcriptional regulator [Burkholderiales bacterium]|nr:IclR family transcriptional regulator [Burkholderiales bacterium]